MHSFNPRIRGGIARGWTCVSLLIALAAFSCSSNGRVELGDDGRDAAVGGPFDAQQAADAEVDDTKTPVDTGVAVDATPAECSGPVTEASLCLGKGSGRAGERVSLPIHIVLPAGCAFTTQVHTTLVPSASVGQFVPHAMTPPSSCWHMSNTTAGGQFMYLSNSAASPCPSQLMSGELVRVELDIAPGTAPGNYDIALTDVTVGDSYAACRGKGAIGGRLTVLP